jgi:hypothetical protein
MRRGSASPAAKPLENQGLETPGEKTPRLLIYIARISHEPEIFFMRNSGY